MNQQVHTEEGGKKIDVDNIVKNNTKDENDKIITEFETVKKTIAAIQQYKNQYINIGKTDESYFYNSMKTKFGAFAETYSSLFTKAADIKELDMDMCYQMINKQIDVAKKKKSYIDVSTDFGERLHNKYVKPKISK